MRRGMGSLLALRIARQVSLLGRPVFAKREVLALCAMSTRYTLAIIALVCALATLW